MAKGAGRRKGSRNKGYFFRSGRGWYICSGGKYVPLVDAEGLHIRGEETPQRVLKEAAAQRRLAVSEAGNEPDEIETKLPGIAIEAGAVCGAYLEHLKAAAGEFDPANPKGMAKTYIDRGQTLYDFCYGLPGEFFCVGDKEKRERKIAKLDGEKKRIHDGYGWKSCLELTPADVDAWLQAHKWTQGGWRTRVQALKRAFNFGVERKMILVSPILGYRLPQSTARVTYLTPEQETAMLTAASPAFAVALRVCIRTGARFGCEFAALTAGHIRDHHSKMEWVFSEQESKTHKQRIIRITDPEILGLVREAVKLHPEGPVFRNKMNDPWTRKMLSQNFRRAKAKLKLQKFILDKDACMYSCRHTYAKRTLEGYWTGKPASINSLARLMGNSVQVCIKHYLQFSGADNEMLWGSA